MSRALAAGLALVLLAGCGGDDDPTAVTAEPAPTLDPAAPTTTGVVPEGFDRASITLTDPDGEVLAWCVWLAATPAQREQGLMEVTDLGGAEGMLFRFGTPTQGRFYMLRTRLPLSIAFFGAQGELVSATDMEPCPDDDDDPPCPRYAATGPFVDALEVPAGALGAAGVGPGTILSVGSGGC